MAFFLHGRMRPVSMLTVVVAIAGCSWMPAVGNADQDRHQGFVTLERSGPPTPVGPFGHDRSISFFCDPRTNCPELTVKGGPIDHACLVVDGRPVFEVCPVRGLHDASISADATTGALFMAYTHASMTFAGAVSPDAVMGTHTTRLARSDDAGRTWQMVGEINTGESFGHPDRGLGVISHEVATIEQDVDRNWVMLWQKHFNTRGQEYNDVVLSSRTAVFADRLATDRSQPQFSGWLNPPVWPATTNLADRFSELANCTAFTEPALLRFKGVLYGALECIAWDLSRNRRNTIGSGLHLFEFPGGIRGEPRYIGRLAGADDVFALTGHRNATISQASLAQSRQQGRLVLLASLWEDDRQPTTSGCIALEIEDIARAQLARGVDGDPIVLAEIGAVSNPGKALGPGQCEYDPLSETGVLITYMYEDREFDPVDLRISVHATGVHP